VDCLQTFRNGYYHKHLDRKAAKERLAAWGARLSISHEIPPKQPSKEPREGTHPVNEAERRLRHLLLAAGFEEGIRGEQIRLDRAIGTTTPDIIYRAPHHAENEGVCIYLDGLSEHLHGNPVTAEQDQRIRSWLRNNGYEVIEIAASDLHDADAMVRHFRRLAGYLGANSLRDSLRSDTSWFRRVEQAATSVGRSVLRIVRPRPEDRYVTCVPLMPLEAAAGYFSGLQSAPAGEWDSDWVELDTHRRLRPGMFVAKVVGKSMEPAIPDGSYCLFTGPVTGSRQGRTVLVQLRDDFDPETGGRYTVKRYSSEKAASDDGTWRHVRITLVPNNPDFEPIELTVEDEGTVGVIAEMLETVQ
jgi:phage repressor protein C with HTH and peptisase S24 domain